MNPSSKTLNHDQLNYRERRKRDVTRGSSSTARAARILPLTCCSRLGATHPFRSRIHMSQSQTYDSHVLLVVESFVGGISLEKSGQPREEDSKKRTVFKPNCRDIRAAMW
ncbi:hypothetical protein L2E82_05005 [Cichorium intybus]|uniref:Uncharacterized protein n=1 Tax=Cichorium intybus TaxID=13427 RepID=A0ACB9H6X1_CICIN|nr:hypothetical protein L2E82_05005 [Cichorium intybus]